jgi:HSP20 family molecular chaperone IbpA
MRKEILIATLAGVVLGLIVAFGIWRTNSVLKKNTSESISGESNSTNNNSEPEDFKITIATPEENDVISQNPVKISGITKVDSCVVISTEDEDYVIKADASGNFEQDVELSAGPNQVLISAQDNATDSVSQKNLLLVYSTEFAKQIDEENQN